MSFCLFADVLPLLSYETFVGRRRALLLPGHPSTIPWKGKCFWRTLMRSSGWRERGRGASFFVQKKAKMLRESSYDQAKRGWHIIWPFICSFVDYRTISSLSSKVYDWFTFVFHSECDWARFHIEQTLFSILLVWS